ncbi:MAG TPA: VOC family protein [Alphaproteobacteria bacterium]|nr:VOC family protein [Alphaproteobacteria bacterium]
MPVQNPPNGNTAVTPHLIIEGAAKAIEFYKQAFDAIELFRMDGPGGKIMHAQIAINGANIMLCDAMPEKGAHGPKRGEPNSSFIYLYIADADHTMKKAVAAGAKVLREVETHFYGDRAGLIVDPFGHTWWISTHVEDVSMDELKKRAAEMQKKQSAA